MKKLALFTIPFLVGSIGTSLLMAGFETLEAKNIHFENYHHSPKIDPTLLTIDRPKIEATASKSDLVALIARKAVEHGISPILALQIAFKESSYNPKAHHPVSSAKGLYQFIDGTWKNYCKGDVYDAEDNLQCFLTNYPTHKSWWK